MHCQLRLNRPAGKASELTHLELARVLGSILDEVHRVEVRSSTLDSIAIVSTVDLADGEILVKIDSVPFLDVFGVLGICEHQHDSHLASPRLNAHCE